MWKLGLRLQYSFSGNKNLLQIFAILSLQCDSHLADWLLADQHIREISGFDIKGPAHLGDYQVLKNCLLWRSVLILLIYVISVLLWRQWGIKSVYSIVHGESHQLVRPKMRQYLENKINRVLNFVF
jgi:hypothetical protein